MASNVRAYIQDNYCNHLKMYTDGSLLDNDQAGSAFVIPALKIEKSYCVGKHRSVFTAELIAVLMGLSYILDLSLDIFHILICVDSKSVLHAIKSPDYKNNCKIILEIKHFIHVLSLRGIAVTFCWVPSHIGLYSNEWADRAAKKGVSNKKGSTGLHIPLSVQEGYHLLERACVNKQKELHQLKEQSSNWFLNKKYVFDDISKTKAYTNIIRGRQVKNLFFRIRMNAFVTKFSKNVQCLCGESISNAHVMFDCQNMKPYLPTIPHNSLEEVLNDVKLMFDMHRV